MRVKAGVERLVQLRAQEWGGRLEEKKEGVVGATMVGTGEMR